MSLDIFTFLNMLLLIILFFTFPQFNSKTRKFYSSFTTGLETSLPEEKIFNQKKIRIFIFFSIFLFNLLSLFP